MKMLKKIAAVALAGVMALGAFTACGSETSNLTDKLNNAGKGYSFTYSVENSQKASKNVNKLKSSYAIAEEYRKDMEEAAKEEDADKKAQKELSAAVDANSKLSSAGIDYEIESGTDPSDVSDELCVVPAANSETLTDETIYTGVRILKDTKYKDMTEDELVDAFCNLIKWNFVTSGKFGYYAGPISVVYGDETTEGTVISYVISEPTGE